MVASLIAAGYVLGEDVVQKARDFDTRSALMSRLETGAEAIKTKAQQIDDEYRLGDKLKEFGEKVTTAVKNFDEKVRLSEAVERAIAHPTVQEGLNKLKTVGAQIGEAVKTTIDAQIQAVEIAIEERHRTRAIQQQQQQEQQHQDNPQRAGGAKVEEEGEQEEQEGNEPVTTESEADVLEEASATPTVATATVGETIATSQ